MVVVARQQAAVTNGIVTLSGANAGSIDTLQMIDAVSVDGVIAVAADAPMQLELLHFYLMAHLYS